MAHEQPRRTRVLFVDDDRGLVDFLTEMATEAGLAAQAETAPTRALERVRQEVFDVVVSDVEMPGMRGPELMARIHEARPGQLVILMTAFGSIDLAVRSMHAGASDFIAKPFPFDALLLAIERALRERSMRREIVRLTQLLEPLAAGDLVARSPVMRKVVSMARRAAGSRATVLLTGESGVGKSAVAQLIHRESPRAGGPFVSLNCAALPASLAESELFGAKRGAFTGATEDREGIFARAHQGTLFLDEVGELSLELQPKLLDVLETGRFRALGGGPPRETDVRLVAATNRRLEDAVAAKEFRSDLFFRLNVVRIEVPPLRDRLEDLPALVDVLVRRAAARINPSITGISGDALRALMRHDWPGNVRELANVVERACVMAEHDTLVLEDLALGPTPVARGSDFLDDAARRQAPLAEVELAYIQRVLASVGRQKTEAARILGIDRRTLYRRLEENGTEGEPET